MRTILLRALVPLALGLSFVIFALSARAQGASEQVGALTCAGCHASEHEKWRQSPHARSARRLVGVYREDQACLQCHAPSAEAGLQDVQCETCHGGGRYYFAEYVMRDSELARLVGLRDPDEATCLVCHDANTARLVPFDYEKARERIRHW